MSNLRLLYARKSVRVFVWFSIIFLGFSLSAWLLKPVLIPFILSLALYVLFEPINIALLRRGVSASQSAIVVVVIILLILYAFVSVVLPMLSEQFYLLLERLPAITSSVEQLGNNLSQQINVAFDMQDFFHKIEEYFHQSFSTIFFHGSSFLVSVATVFLMIPIFTFFLLKDFQQIRNALLATLSNQTFELGWVIYRRVAKKLQVYMRGLMLQSFIVALVCTGGFIFLGLESPLLLGILAGLFNIIPYVGPLFAMVLPVLTVMSQVPLEPLMIAAAIGVILLSQLIDNVLVIPLVIADAVNLHPLIVIVGLIIFGSYFGLLGMLVAIPVLATANIILQGLNRGLQVQPG